MLAPVPNAQYSKFVTYCITYAQVYILRDSIDFLPKLL